MSNDGYYTDLDHPSSQHPAGIETLQTMPSHHLSGLEQTRIKHARLAFKDYFCPFCGEILFRGKVRGYKMACHKCNRLVDSTKREE